MSAIYNPKVNKTLSPYVAGALIGVLSWVSIGLWHKPIGASTTFVRAAGVIESAVSVDHVENNSYFSKYLSNKPAFEWQASLVFAIFFGSLLASKLSKSRKVTKVPFVWSNNFGASKTKRYVAAFLGGFLVLFGARLAGGCTSGHGISGALQLAVSGWLFLAALFAAGIATAFIVYKHR